MYIEKVSSDLAVGRQSGAQISEENCVIKTECVAAARSTRERKASIIALAIGNGSPMTM